MLSLNQTFDDTRTVKVLVVPVGNNSLFDAHFQVVSSLRDVPFYELNRPQTSQRGPFKYFDWNDGNLLFDFLRYDRVQMGPGELNNFQSSKRILMVMGLINYPELGSTAECIDQELDYYCRRHPNIILKRLFVFNFTFDDPNATVPTSLSRGLADDPNSLIIFPPEGNCGEDGGGSMVDVHLNEVMSHAALQIIYALEQQMTICLDARAKNVFPPSLQLSTIYDDLGRSMTAPFSSSSIGDLVGGFNSGAVADNASIGGATGSMNGISGSSSNQQKRPHKRRPAARLHKWMGDLSLQVCSPRDAVDHYASAIYDCRAIGETLWLAGALDGYASALLLLRQMRGNLEEAVGRELRHISLPQYLQQHVDASSNVNGASDSGGASNGNIPAGDQQDGTAAPEDGASSSAMNFAVEKAFVLAEERANEAAAIFSSNIVFCALEVDCLLRLARLHEVSPYSLRKENRVLHYALRALEVPGLNALQQIECVTECGLVFHRLGMRRKYAMMLVVAALLSAEGGNFSVAHGLMRYACSTFGLTTGMDIMPPLKMASAVHRGYAATKTEGPELVTMRPASELRSWRGICTALLCANLVLAEENGDSEAAARYSSVLIELLQDAEEEQQQFRERWKSCSVRQLLGKYAAVPFFHEDGLHTNSSLPPLAELKSADRCSPVLSPVSQETSSGGIVLDEEETVRRHASSRISDVTATSRITSRDLATNSSLHRKNDLLGASGVTSARLVVDDDHVPNGGKIVRLTMSESDPSLGGQRTPSTAASVTAPAVHAPSSTQPLSPSRSIILPKLPEKLLYLAQTGCTVSPSDATSPTLPSFGRFFWNLGATISCGSGEDENGGLMSDITQSALASAMAIIGSKSGLYSKQVQDAFASLFPVRIQMNERSASSTEKFNEGAVEIFAEKRQWLHELFSSFGSLTAANRYSLDLQQEAVGIFLRNTKLIAPYSCISVPIKLLAVHPLNSIGQLRPRKLEHTGALEAIRKGKERLEGFFAQHKSLSISAKNSIGDESMPTGGEVHIVENSSLYYDPFAAMRKRQKAMSDLKQRPVDIVWSVGSMGLVRVSLGNALALPILIERVELMVQGTAECRIFARSVHVPPNVRGFALDLSVLPISTGVIKVMGLQLMISNAFHCISIDSIGCMMSEIRVVSAASTFEASLSSCSGTRCSNCGSSTKSLVLSTPATSFVESDVWNEEATSKGINDVDLSVSLEIFPGERRTEQLSIRRIPARIPAGKSLQLIDWRLSSVGYRAVSCANASHIKEPQTQQNVQADFSSLLSEPNSTLMTSQGIEQHSTAVPVRIEKIEKDSNHGSDTLLFSIEIQHIPKKGANVNMLDICFDWIELQIQQTSEEDVLQTNTLLTGRALHLLKDLGHNLGSVDDSVEEEARIHEILNKYSSQNYGRGCEELLRSELRSSVQHLENDIFFRRMRLRIFLQQVGGVLLHRVRELYPQRMSTNQSAKLEEEKNISLAKDLRRLLVQNCKARQLDREFTVDSRIQSCANEADDPKLCLFNSSSLLYAMLELRNSAAVRMVVGTSTLQVQNSLKDFDGNHLQQLDMIFDFSKIVNSSRAFFAVPPNSSARLIIRYRRGMNAFHEAIQLFWGTIDSRSEGRNDCVRLGVVHSPVFQSNGANALCLPTIDEQKFTVDLSPHGTLLRSLLHCDPLLEVHCSIEGINADVRSTQSMSLDVETRKCFHFVLSAGKFYICDISIACRQLQEYIANSTDAAVGNEQPLCSDAVLELAILIQPRNPAERCASLSTVDAERSSPSESVRRANSFCMLSGKALTRHAVSSNTDTVSHRVQICFPFTGVYSMDAIAAISPYALIEQQSNREQWWRCSKSAVYFSVKYPDD